MKAPQLVFALLLVAVAQGQGDRGLAATGAASARQPAQLQRRLQQAAGDANSTASDGVADEDDVSTATKPKRCRPSLVDVARQYPQLRQMVQLAAAGYNAFSVDGGKNFTVLLPTNAALQALAADAASLEEQQSLEDGFYSVLLYHQIPGGAYNLSRLVAEGYSGLQTSLGRALGADDGRFSVSLDGSTRPVVATGGWPANNAQLLASREACNGWLHVIDAVLLPTQSFSDLPRLVDDVPDLRNGSSFWELLDGSLLGAAPAPSSDSGGDGGGESPDASDGGTSPAPDGGNDGSEGGGMRHSNDTEITVSSGNGAPMPATPAPPAGGDVAASSGGGSSERVLVIAASVAGAAVAACVVVVAVVLLRRRAAEGRRRRGAMESLAQQEEEAELAGLATKRGSSLRPVTLLVDA